MTTLEQGLQFPLPDNYEENNNRSVQDNERLMWDKMMEWEEAQ